MIIPNALNNLHHPDFNYGEFATVSSILEPTTIAGKTIILITTTRLSSRSDPGECLIWHDHVKGTSIYYG